MDKARDWFGWRPASIVQDNRIFAKGTVLDFIFTPKEVVSLTALLPAESRATNRRQAQRRSIILANTRRIISEGGIGDVRIRELAARSRVTPPTIYALVGTKHDIVQQALLEGLEAKFILAERRAAAEDINPILAFGAVKWNAIARDSGYYRQIVRGATDGRLDLSTVVAIHTAIADRFLRWFKEMKASGLLRVNTPFHSSLVAPLLARQFAVPVASWATERITLAQLRSDIIASLALPLLGVVTEAEQKRILEWLERAHGSACICS